MGRGGHRTEQEGPHLPQTLALPAQHPDHRLHSQNHDVPSSLDWYRCPPTRSPAPITFSLSVSLFLSLSFSFSLSLGMAEAPGPRFKLSSRQGPYDGNSESKPHVFIKQHGF